MVPIVVHPLRADLVHPDWTNVRVDPDPHEIVRAEAANECDAADATTFRLDEVADALVRAPFVGRRPLATLRPEGGHLGLHGPGTRGKQIRDPV